MKIFQAQRALRLWTTMSLACGMQSTMQVLLINYHQSKGLLDQEWEMYLKIFSPATGIVTVLNSAKRWTPVDKQELDKVSLFLINLLFLFCLDRYLE